MRSQKVHTFLSCVKTRLHTHYHIFDIVTAVYGVNSNVQEQHMVFYHQYMHTYNWRHLSPCLPRHFPSSLERFGARFSHLQQAWSISVLFHSVQRHNQTMSARLPAMNVRDNHLVILCMAKTIVYIMNLTCLPRKKRRCLSGSALKWSTNFIRRSSIFVSLLKSSIRTFFCPSMLLTWIHILMILVLYDPPQ